MPRTFLSYEYLHLPFSGYVYSRAEYILSPKATKAKKKIKEQLKADKKAAKSRKEADQMINLVALEGIIELATNGNSPLRWHLHYR